MTTLFGLQHIKDISITRKLYFIVGTMAVLIALELLILWFAIHTLSAVRAFVSAEGLWSKAQKDAVYHLRKYNRTQDEADYKAFQGFMDVPLGDHMTRLELMKENPDLDIARAGFRKGRVHEADIDGMIRLVQWFNKVSYIDSAIQYWRVADSIIAPLIPIGDLLHQEMISANPSQVKMDSLVQLIDPINEQLTKQEDGFSSTLGDGSRWLERIILKLLFSVALTVEITGLLLTISVSRGITKGLKEINRASQKISKGDLSERAIVYSKDEIGQAAVAINQMTEQLVLSNQELTQFAYVASHDLQEPLRTVANYSDLFQKQYKGRLDADADKYLAAMTAATGRMQTLIKDLLDYSRIGINKELTKVDCNKLVKEIVDDLLILIQESEAEISRSELPVIMAYPDIKSLFQNLISNAIKFRKSGSTIKINISAQNQSNDWLFAISDNGIGIDKEFHERIFIIFQKLHSKKQYAGTGIGLAHCKKIVELHGGKIWVESSIESGSTFYFTISKKINL